MERKRERGGEKGKGALHITTHSQYFTLLRTTTLNHTTYYLEGCSMPICEYYSSLIPQYMLTTMAFLERNTLTDSYRCFLVSQVYHEIWLTLAEYEYEHVQYLIILISKCVCV